MPPSVQPLRDRATALAGAARERALNLRSTRVAQHPVVTGLALVVLGAALYSLWANQRKRRINARIGELSESEYSQWRYRPAAAEPTMQDRELAPVGSPLT